MDRGLSDRARALAGKYRYAAAAALLGVLLMLLPVGGRRETRPADTQGVASVQSEIEAALAAFDGAGRLRLVLTVEPGTERWAGAVIVCEGGGSAAVRLQLTQAVAALTGLSADRIAVVKGRP
jgi:stage III sporulation protein AG